MTPHLLQASLIKLNAFLKNLCSKALSLLWQLCVPHTLFIVLQPAQDLLKLTGLFSDPPLPALHQLDFEFLEGGTSFLFFFLLPALHFSWHSVQFC